MNDLHGNSANGGNREKKRRASDEWAGSGSGKSTGDFSAISSSLDDEFESEVQNLIKNKMSEIKSQTQTAGDEEMGVPTFADESYGQNDAEPEDGTQILQEQKSLLSALTFRFAGCAVCAVALILLAIAPVLHLPLPYVLDPTGNPVDYIAANLVLLLIVGVIGFAVAFKGIANIFTLRPDADGLTSLAFYASVAGTVYVLYRYATVSVAPADLPVTAVFAACEAVCITLNLLGKVFLVSRVTGSLSLLEKLPGEDGFYTADLLDEEQAQGVMRTFAGSPFIATAKRVRAFNDFLGQSYAPTPSDNASRILAPAAMVAATLAAVCELLVKQDASGAIIAFVAICCAAAAPMFEFGVAVPFWRAARRLKKQNVLVAGYTAVDNFGEADAAVADAHLLFSDKSIRIFGIKPFSGYKIEEVVLYAASLAKAGQSPLAGPLLLVFSDSGSGKNMLRPAEKVVYEDEKGLSAIIDGKVVLLGNRGLLRHHLIDAPSRDFELRYTSDNREVAYLAVDGVICAIFVLGYELEAGAAGALRRLCRMGVQILVRSSDPNISPQLIEEKCGMTTSDITLLGAREMQMLEPQEEPVGSIPAAIAFKSMGGYMAALSSAIRLRGALRTNTTMQTVFAVVGILFVFYAAFFGGGVFTFTPAYLLAYQALCAVPVLLVSLLRHN